MLTLLLSWNLINKFMKQKEHVIFDKNSDRFRYLYREDKIISKKVDMDELNARLNESRKINIYTNIKIVALCLTCLTIVSLISLKF